jgi:hypothetical protein
MLLHNHIRHFSTPNCSFQHGKGRHCCSAQATARNAFCNMLGVRCLGSWPTGRRCSHGTEKVTAALTILVWAQPCKADCKAIQSCALQRSAAAPTLWLTTLRPAQNCMRRPSESWQIRSRASGSTKCLSQRSPWPRPLVPRLQPHLA